MVKTVKLKKPSVSQGSPWTSEFTRIESWHGGYYQNMPPPKGGQPIFWTPFIDGSMTWESIYECQIFAGKLSCGNNIFNVLTPPRFDVIDDGCNKGIMLSFPWFAGTRKSFFTYYRSPNCRIEKEKEFTTYRYTFEPTDPCEDSQKAIYIWWKVEALEYEDYRIFHHPKAAAGYSYYTTESAIEYVVFPEDETELNGIGKPIRVYARIGITVVVRWEANEPIKERYGWEGNFEGKEVLEDVFTHEHTIYFGDTYVNLGIPGHFIGAGVAYRHYDDFVKRSKETFQEVIVVGKYEYPQDNYVFVTFDDNPIVGTTKTPFREITSRFETETVDFLGYRYFVYRSNVDTAIDINSETWYPVRACEDEPLPEPPPKKKSPPPPREPKMRCCPDNSYLLRQILKIVKQNNKAIGYNAYPVKVPSSLINANGREPGLEDTESLTDLLIWYIKRFDEIVGQFEIPINVEDADLTQEGNQGLEVRLPNISESIAEMFLMLLNLNITNEVQINMITRILAETGADKQQNFKSYMALEAIIEFLGFKYTDEVKGLPLTFTPGKEVLSEILKEVEVGVSCIEYNDDTNLPKQMYELLQAAAIIRAKHWKPLDAKQNIKQQLLSSILQNKSLLEELKKPIDLKELEDELNKLNKEQEQQ